ncbi:MarR family transcriptional regulator [Aquibacillus sp. 3ASR75-11]|uniref:MarR family transcriptional regulator n=1 Tax=Terrihalobacillus insolitus TaxID=2950438 RepID=A0A9X3WNU2_9BACI|nr:MarR family transcriptional regulator [Terrihalobacillus insolitus]MDC3412211.1 MarR family transcriptional regulator [Terrihalobacillus insolitus]MDC3423095.1 MarR family transcriptional regulator [Terrihalobacillus insolitus]
MDKESLQLIELEMAVLVRRLTTIASKKTNGNLDRAAYLLLHQLSIKGTAGVKTLAFELQLDISTVSRQAAALEQKGYVSKSPNPLDLRAYFYQITESGKKEWMKYKQARLDKISELLSEWSDEERKNFGQLLKKFNDEIKGKI